MSTSLEEKRYPYLKDSLYQVTLQNGLKVSLLPRQDFHETYGVMSVQFGAVDTQFKTKNQSAFTNFPAGIAHFLEHKLFETQEGGDALQDFFQLGATANAYTDLQQTCYLFSTTENTLPALELLQCFIREAHFTEESVEHEKEIITQEIEMYQDDPDSRLMTEILASLYPETPLAADIAGSVSSIQKISVEDLHENFNFFYQASNMHLFLIGNFDVESVWKQISQFQSCQQDVKLPIERKSMEYFPVLEHRTMELEVASPKLAIGIRGRNEVEEKSRYRYQICLTMLFSMLFGWTSKRYQYLYEAGKISSSLSVQITVQPNYHFVILTVDTEEPIVVSNLLRKALSSMEQDSDITREHLELLKRECYGDFIQSLNSLEMIATQFIAVASEEESWFDLPNILNDIQLEDVLEVGKQFVSNCDMTDFTIFPK